MASLDFKTESQAICQITVSLPLESRDDSEIESQTQIIFPLGAVSASSFFSPEQETIIAAGLNNYSFSNCLSYKLR